MTDGLLTHPTHEQLAAFGAGRLSDEESVTVEEHLRDCVACCQSLKHMPGDDSYVCLLREAGSEANQATLLFTPTVAAAGAETDGLHDAKAHPSLPTIPPELAEHPRYRVIRLLGSGGMGAVYEAEHRLMRRRVALKIIKPEWFRHSAAVARFRREMQAAAKLVHPHVVTAFDAEQAGELHFLAMEFFDGLTLAELVQQRGPLPVDMACECIRQAALGLQQAHEQEMVHRDIKPGNLMVSRDARVSVKILDFGLARFASEAEDDGRETSANTMLGTPDFMAPEQARDARSADIRSDIYSLGCTLHFLLTGEVPHPGLATAIERAIAHLEREPLPASAFRSDIPDGLREVLSRMIAKQPSDRFQTPAEVTAALTPFADPAVAQPLLLSPKEVFPQRTLAAGFQRVLMALGLVGFVLLMAVIVHVVTDKGDLRIRTEIDGAVILLSQNG
jgi:tRNA A-37 threonylcarbamoyl transferase component Bud32